MVGAAPTTRPTHRGRAFAVLCAWALSTLCTAAHAQGDRPSERALRAQVEGVAAQLAEAEQALGVVETQYVQRTEQSEGQALAERYSDGEIHYLLGDWRAASILFYDLVSDPRFARTEHYADALFFLSDALYQQQNFIGARLYLRQLLSLRSSHYPDALSRYLELASRAGEFSGIEGYIEDARRLGGGALSDDLTYVYGKWLFKRGDKGPHERITESRPVFLSLWSRPGPFRLQSGYFLGVGLVMERRYEEAVQQFGRVVSAPAEGARDVQVQQMANLSLGRVLYELGRYDEAIDRYQEIPEDSAAYVDALYEMAWTHVRREKFEEAKNATDILLMVAPDSTVAPDARILQGHLLLKLKRYQQASAAYADVIDYYGPVRDEVETLLRQHPDPVAYFDKLLAQNDGNLDVAQLLPQVALKWAAAHREVADAVNIVDDLETGRRSVLEGQEIAHRILAALDERGLETFPELQEGYTRADAVDQALMRAEEVLVEVESWLLRDLLVPDDRRALNALLSEKAKVKTRFGALPASPGEVELRRRRLQQQVDGVDATAFRAGYNVQSLVAQTTALEHLVASTRPERSTTSETDAAFLATVQAEARHLAQLQAALDRVRRSLQVERERVNAQVGGEAQIRAQYAALLDQERALLSRALPKVSGAARELLDRAQVMRQKLAPLRPRVAQARARIEAMVRDRGAAIRAKVLAEQRLLQEYAGEVAQVSGDTRQLVGNIAFASFRRVQKQFYDLVLKADVGIVDVAFTRKQDQTDEIQRLSQQRERELRTLEREFKEVLTDVDP